MKITKLTYSAAKAFTVFSSFVIRHSLLVTLLITGCTSEDMMFKESRVLMDTYCTITVVSPSQERAREAIDAGYAEIKKLETLLNYFSENSELTAINRAAGISPVKVSGETLEIFEKTLDIYRMSNGAFDATIAPVLKYWKFSKDKTKQSVPSIQEIEEALKLVDYTKVEINRPSSGIKLSEKGMELDLGGIAKGYGADKAVNAIKAKGIRAALVAIAGDIRGYGISTSGDGWKVGIQNPRPDTESDKPWEDIFAKLELNDKAISTSGDYQRFFIKEGKRYHHIINPETGFPADSGLISVSVIAPEGYLSDSLATAVFIMGAEKGLSLLRSNGYDGVLVTGEKKVIITPDLKDKIQIINKAYQLAD